MKINWGTGIAIFYSLFVIVMVSMVIKSTHHKAHLVKEDYYNHDINYEDFRLKRQNGKKYEKAISIEYLHKEKSLNIKFPKEIQEAIGEVTLFRSSNKSLDKKFVLSLNDSSEMTIPIDNLFIKGLWKIMLDWELNGTKYYNEEDIVI